MLEAANWAPTHGNVLLPEGCKISAKKDFPLQGLIESEMYLLNLHAFLSQASHEALGKHNWGAQVSSSE